LWNIQINTDYSCKFLIATGQQRCVHLRSIFSNNRYLLSYCYMCFILIKPINWTSLWTWWSKVRSQNC